MKKYKVYRIYNMITKKSYIGYTSLSIDKRFHKHYTNSLFGIKSKLYDSIRKYGADKFTLSILFETDTKEEALKSEKNFISKFDTFKNGYNMTLGGDGGDCTIYMSEEEIIEYRKKLSILNSGKNNNRFSGYTDDELIEFGVRCYLDNNNWIQSHWMKNYCEKYGIPKSYSKFRFNGEGLRGFKKRMLERLLELGYSVESVGYKITKEHKDKLSKLYKNKKWYHNDKLKKCNQLSEDQIDENWIRGIKKYN